MATRYTTAQQALTKGIITEADWKTAIAHPWTWVVLPGGVKVREIPWQGLEVETPEKEE